MGQGQETQNWGTEIGVWVQIRMQLPSPSVLKPSTTGQGGNQNAMDLGTICGFFFSVSKFMSCIEDTLLAWVQDSAIHLLITVINFQASVLITEKHPN